MGSIRKRSLATRLVLIGSRDGLRGYSGLKMTPLVIKFMDVFPFPCLLSYFPSFWFKQVYGLSYIGTATPSFWEGIGVRKNERERQRVGDVEMNERQGEGDRRKKEGSKEGINQAKKKEGRMEGEKEGREREL